MPPVAGSGSIEGDEAPSALFVLLDMVEGSSHARQVRGMILLLGVRREGGLRWVGRSSREAVWEIRAVAVVLFESGAYSASARPRRAVPVVVVWKRHTKRRLYRRKLDLRSMAETGTLYACTSRQGTTLVLDKAGEKEVRQKLNGRGSIVVVCRRASV